LLQANINSKDLGQIHGRKVWLELFKDTVSASGRWSSKMCLPSDGKSLLAMEVEW